MATVYTHINPFQKRAIDYFRQCINHIGERGKIGSVLDELLRKQEFFRELLASPAFLSVEQQAYVQAQRVEVEEELIAANAELAMLKSIRQSLNPCPDCDGNGEFRIQVSSDSGRYEKCGACDGDGVESGAVPARGG